MKKSDKTDKADTQQELEAALALAFDSNRRKALLDTGSSDVWLVSFTDIIALMLTFFVLIFSMIEPKHDIWADITFSLRQDAGYSAAGNAGALPLEAGQRQKVTAGEDLNYLASILRENMAHRPQLKEAVLIQKPDRLIISLPESLLFASGSFAVKPAVKEEIAAVFGLLKTLKNGIDVYGHTDPVPVSRENDAFRSNFGLAQQRAAEVSALVYKAGYHRPISIFGLPAQESDVSDNQRRVDIIIHKNRITAGE